jgi:hypothetical protein
VSQDIRWSVIERISVGLLSKGQTWPLTVLQCPNAGTGGRMSSSQSTLTPPSIKTVISEDIELKVSPNPVTSTLKISGVVDGNSVVVRDVTGKEAYKGKFQREMNVSALAPGVYIVTVQDGTGQHSLRFVKQ